MQQILSLARAGASGRDWYRQAEQSVRGVGGDDWDMLARLLAVTSPQSTVEQNAGWAVQALRWWQAAGRVAPESGHYHVGRFDAVGRRVTDVLRGGEVTGPKCWNFYRALTGDVEAVAIDQFVAAAMGLEDVKRLTPVVYGKMATDLRWLAHNVVGWEPRQLQAALWAAAPRKRVGGSMVAALERADAAQRQGRLWVDGPRGVRGEWEVQQ